MTPLELSTLSVDGAEVPVLQTVCVHSNCLRVGAGTTGYRGGDSGHGGRTVVMLRDEGGTDLRCEVNGQQFDGVTELKIVVGGDAELFTLIEALEFTVETLKGELDRQRAERASRPGA